MKGSTLCFETDGLENGTVMGSVVRKRVFGVSDQVRHKLGCTATDDSKSLKSFRTYEVEGLHYLCCENKGADQLRGYRAGICAFDSAYAKTGFLMTGLKKKELLFHLVNGT